MSALKLLLVEDDLALAELLEYRFKSEGYDVRATAFGEEAIAFATNDPPDLVLLDWMLDDVSGIDVCRRLREGGNTARIPVIMLTARNAEDDRVHGLEAGADDYVTKPFSPRELLARVAAVLRRARPESTAETIKAGDLLLDPVAHHVRRRGQLLQLGPTEYRMLKHFMEHPRRVFSRSQLLNAVWGSGREVEERTVDVHIRRLRKAIAIDGANDPIRTVRSAGYALEAR